jgi:G:T-mismatch repair DNA endonuclease (very short patch repair protein)
LKQKKKKNDEVRKYRKKKLEKESVKKFVVWSCEREKHKRVYLRLKGTIKHICIGQFFFSLFLAKVS